MRFHYNNFSKTLEVFSNSDAEIDENVVMMQLQTLLKINPDVRTLDISGLNADEVTCLHAALICLKEKLRGFTTIHYQLEEVNAISRLKEEFAQWKIEIYEKSSAIVERMQDYNNVTGVYRILKFQSNSALKNADLLQIDPRIVMGENTKTPEGASTGCAFLKEIKPGR